MAFNPAKDGSIIWSFLHLMAANATTDRKRELYVQWLNNLKETFPCEICRVHLIKNLEELPIEPYSKTNVSCFYHSWKLHDTVNGQLHKSQNRCLTYEEAFEKYFGKPVAEGTEGEVKPGQNSEQHPQPNKHPRPDKHHKHHRTTQNNPGAQPTQAEEYLQSEMIKQQIQENQATQGNQTTQAPRTNRPYIREKAYLPEPVYSSEPVEASIRGYQTRYMAKSSNPYSQEDSDQQIPEQQRPETGEQPRHGCTTCNGGQRNVTVENFDTYRDRQRKIFSPKNP